MTLERWTIEFGRFLSPKETAAAASLREQLAHLLIGLAEASTSDWAQARICATDPNSYQIGIMEHTDLGPQLLMYESETTRYSRGGLSPALIGELDRICGSTLHVSVPGSSRGGHPALDISWAPLMMVDRTEDPVTKLRGLASVPPGAQLIRRPFSTSAEDR